MDAGKDINENNAQARPPESPLKKFARIVGGLESVFVIWGPLEEEFFEKVLGFVKKNKYAEKEKKIEKLTIVLHSGGGDPHLTYKSANVLRGSFKKLTIYVPRFAKSGATLLCLGAQEVVLALGAELGPLDTQIRDPKDPENFISALEVTEALKVAAEFLYTEFGVLLDQLRMVGIKKRDELFSLAMQFIKLMGRPLFEQTEPTNFNACLRALDISRHYGTELLIRSGVEKEKARSIMAVLVEQYPSHSFVIDVDEIKKLDLHHVREANAEEDEALEVLYEYVGYKVENVKRRDRFYGFLSDLRD